MICINNKNKNNKNNKNTKNTKNIKNDKRMTVLKIKMVVEKNFQEN